MNKRDMPADIDSILYMACACGCGTLINPKGLRRWGIYAVGHNRRNHSKASDPTFQIWRAMVKRCTKPSAINWNIYGGRGITVCERWRTFANFLEDMGHRPDGLSIDRINNDGNYEPGNCRWATFAEQYSNRRSNHIVTLSGLSMTVTQWAQRLGIKRHLIYERLKRGWTPERALGQGDRNAV